MEKTSEFYMQEALKEAKKAYELGEVPIGAVVVYQGDIIGRGHNLRETTLDATTHAEMQAIKDANRTLKNWRLEECQLYVTLEPCPMCSGAIILSRLQKVVFGAHDPKGGTCGTFMNLVQDDRFNHQCELESGVLAEESRQLLQSFFQTLRQRNKAAKKESSRQ